MRKTKIILILLLFAISGYAQDYSIQRYVFGSGGGEMTSAAYSLNGTIGQPLVGISSSSSFFLESGFWVGTSFIPSNCDYVPGDVNGSDSYNGLDIIYGVNYFKGGPEPLCPYGSCPIPPCDSFFYCGDVNGSCSFNGLDITYGVSYLKGDLPALIPCPSCPPPE